MPAINDIFTQIIDSKMTVPYIFDADKILQAEKGKKDLKKNLKDCMHYILHTIITKSDRIDIIEQIKECGFIRLNATYLRDICGDRYIDAIRLLEKNNVIEVTPGYMNNFYSKGFRLIGAYSGCETKEILLRAGGPIEKKYLVYNQEKHDKNITLLKKIPYITKWYDKDKLKVDSQKAHDYLEFYRKKMRDQIPLDIDSLKKVQIENRITQRYNSANRTVKSIIAGDFKLTRDGKDNRLHTTISSVKKEFRGFFTYADSALIGIDIRASQPYLLNHLMTDITQPHQEPELNIHNIYPELSDILHSPIHQDQYTIMLRTFESSRVADSNNFGSFNWTADFYKYMVDRDKIMFPNDRVFSERSKTKSDMMVILFFTHENKYNIAYWQRFAALFLKESWVIQYFDALSRKYNQNFLPIFLQRLESRIMLDIICKIISEELPNAPLITIHDSVLTTLDFVDDVEKIIKDSLTKITGIVPGLKRDAETSDEILSGLEKTAVEDYYDIFTSLSKDKASTIMNSNTPLLKKIPKWEGEVLLSTRFVDTEIETPLPEGPYNS